ELYLLCTQLIQTNMYTHSLHDALPISRPCCFLCEVYLGWGGCPVKIGVEIAVVIHFELPIGFIGTTAGAHPLKQRGKTLQQMLRSEEHTSELQSRENLVCRLLLEKKNR